MMRTHLLPAIAVLLSWTTAACDKNGPGTDAPVTPDPALEQAPSDPARATPPEAEDPPGVGAEAPGPPDPREDTPADPPEDTTDPADSERLRVGDDPCTTDADCVPAQCCHADACVAKQNAPDCTDVMCTMECRAGTIDCGGGCLCFEGRCAARLNDLGTGPPER